MNKLFISLLLATMVSFSSNADQTIVVFDNSTSMKRYIETAKFMLQLMVSVAPTDEDLTIYRTSQSYPWSVDLQNRQQVLNQIKKWQPEGGTPWLPMNLSLQQIKANPTDAIKWVIITDGSFDDQPDTQTLRKNLNEIKDASDNPVSVAWLTIGNPQHNSQVRKTILTELNGDENTGNISANKPQDLKGAFTRLIRILTGQGNNPFQDFKLAQNTLLLEPKFPLDGFTLIDLGSGNTSHSAIFDINNAVEKPLIFQSSMLKPDANYTKPHVANTFVFDPLLAIPANSTYHLPLTDQVAENRLVLIPKVGYELELELRDGSGTPIKTGEDHTANKGIFAVAKLNSHGGKNATGSARKLGKFILHLEHQDKGVFESHLMQFNHTSNEMIFEVEVPKSGLYRLSVTYNAPGYLTRRSTRLNLKIEQTIVLNHRLNITPRCAQCAQNSFRFTPSDQTKILADIDWIAPLPDDLTLDLAVDLPAGVSLINENTGEKLSNSQSLTTQKVAKMQLITQRLLPQGNLTGNISLSARAPYLMTISKPLSFQVLVPGVDILLKGHTMDENRLFAIPADQMGNDSLIFGFHGLIAPLSINDLNISMPTWMDYKADLDTQKQTLNITPISWLCDCFVTPGKKELHLEYYNAKNQQHAFLNIPIEVLQVPFWHKCWQEIALFLMVLLVALYVVLWSRTFRFSSRLVVRKYNDTILGEQVQISRKLHSKLSILGIKNEVSALDDLVLLATTDPEKAQLHSSTRPDLKLNGKPLAPLFDQPHPVYVYINDQISCDTQTPPYFYRIERTES